MNENIISQILSELTQGKIDLSQALAELKHFPAAALEHSQFDTQRALRCGLSEVILAEHKTTEHLLEIAEAALAHEGRVLLTRLTAEHFAPLGQRFPQMELFPAARLGAVWGREPGSLGVLAIVSAGTSDAAVVEEAALSARFFGCEVRVFCDLGVAGLHRLLAALPQIRESDIAIVVAGMEGALPSVVAGLVELPVIAVPTSNGYGANFGGMTTLCGMLASCSPGVSVVNIDNGFGAAAVAAKTLKYLQKKLASRDLHRE